MSRAAARRAGVLAYSPRSRELIRRVLRALGHSPLVFTNLDEFLGLGRGAATLDLLVLGDVPDTDSQGRAVAACARDLIGSAVPVLRVPMQQQGRSVRQRGVAGGGTSPRYFSDLYRTILSFLDSLGFDSTPRLLVWDRYAFHPTERIVAFNDEELRLDAVDFDIALELFYSAGRPVAGSWLTRMLPAGEHGANWHRIDNLACTIDELRVALALDGSNGWTLETLPGAAYRLANRAPQEASPTLVRTPAASAPKRRRAAPVADLG
jgi:DNA-binding response OmpR family regulator